MTRVWIVSGIPGSGKSTTARALAASQPRGVHIEGDLLQRMIISGGVPPRPDHDDEAERQIGLSIRNQCLLARSFLDAGFAVVIDYVVTNADRLGEYQRLLASHDPELLILAPGPAVAAARDGSRVGKNVLSHWRHLDNEMREQLGSVGRWIDNSELTVSETISEILRPAMR